ncbi:hypothetical protein T06_1408 [Trichinella sp. T6]|nr:hypothetical protein T06_1408 [Trichinella sp. T6]
MPFTSAVATVSASASGSGKASGHFENPSPLAGRAGQPGFRPANYIGACSLLVGAARAAQVWHARHQSSTSSRCWGQ